MADDNQDFNLEEFQRQQAAAATAASQGQPNAIPAEAEAPQPMRAIDQTFAARGLPTPDTVIAPNANVGQQPTPEQQQQLGIGSHIDQFGQPLGPTHDLSGNPNPAPPGAVGVQGIQSPEEQKFWAANPLGAIPHPVTGELVGLGDTGATKQQTLQTLNPPEQPKRQPAPDFVDIPKIDPNITARRQSIEQEIAAKQEQLQTAITQRFGGGRRGSAQPSQHDVLTQDIRTLEGVRSGLAQTEHQQMQAATVATHQNETAKKEFIVNQDSQLARIALGQITAEPGSLEAKQAIAKIYQDFPYATHDKQTEAALLAESQFHDSRATVIANARAQGLLPAPNEAQIQYAKLQAGIQGHLETAAVEAKANTDANKANEPYSKAATLHAQQTEAAMLEKQYPALKAFAAPAAGVTAVAPTNQLQIKSDAEYNQLPSGSIFVDPNGVKRRKP